MVPMIFGQVACSRPPKPGASHPAAAAAGPLQQPGPGGPGLVHGAPGAVALGSGFAGSQIGTCLLKFAISKTTMCVYI